MTATRRVVLCADDYGLTEGVSRGILDLLEKGRLSATGAMANMPHWPRLAVALKPHADRIGVGLHVNLTTGRPLGAMPVLAPSGTLPSLGHIIRHAVAGRLDKGEVAAEIGRQLDAFEQAFGERPSFVDGHQHVQVLPGVRQMLLEALRARGYPETTWLRDPSDNIAAIVRRRVSAEKALTVKALAWGFCGSVRAAGFAVNEGFSGFSPLDLTLPAERVLGQAFVALGPRPVVMCHPGHADVELANLDSAVDSREEELAYLGSQAFGDYLEEKGIALVARP
jgi:predicted glycoside hydrolase/deacetylase ChbG (UPF0249 family)